MSYWETEGKSDDWFTPSYIFKAMEVSFDLDVAGNHLANVPASKMYTKKSLDLNWNGFIWMNPPFGKRNGLIPWLDKFFDHGNGIALTPDRTSAPWFQSAIIRSDAVLFVAGKIRFIKPDGTEGKSPSTGTALFASGDAAVKALGNASKNKLGVLVSKIK